MIATATVESQCHYCGGDLEYWWDYCPQCGTSASTSSGATNRTIVIKGVVSDSAPEREEKEEEEGPRPEWWNTWPAIDDAQNPKPVPEATREPRQPPDELGLDSHPVRAPPLKNKRQGVDKQPPVANLDNMMTSLE
jgi:hypothetical protein